jgi:hypothetical protein
MMAQLLQINLQTSLRGTQLEFNIKLAAPQCPFSPSVVLEKAQYLNKF